MRGAVKRLTGRPDGLEGLPASTGPPLDLGLTGPPGPSWTWGLKETCAPPWLVPGPRGLSHGRVPGLPGDFFVENIDSWGEIKIC